MYQCTRMYQDVPGIVLWSCSHRSIDSGSVSIRCATRWSSSRNEQKGGLVRWVSMSFNEFQWVSHGHWISLLNKSEWVRKLLDVWIPLYWIMGPTVVSLPSWVTFASAKRSLAKASQSPGRKMPQHQGLTKWFMFIKCTCLFVVVCSNLTNMIYQRFDSIWHQQAACDHQTGTINDCEILSHKAFAVWCQILSRRSDIEMDKKIYTLA